MIAKGLIFLYPYIRKGSEELIAPAQTNANAPNLHGANYKQITRVKGKNGIRRKFVAPDSAEIILDEKSFTFYLIQRDRAGYTLAIPYKL